MTFVIEDINTVGFMFVSLVQIKLMISTNLIELPQR